MQLLDYKILGVQVFLEKRISRLYVGDLKKVEDQFYFEYDQKYLKAKNVIPLGPEMPLTRRIYKSKTLFIPFSDRIPSKENPAYVDYCRATGISADESDPFVLLSTIAHRGPSSFIFEPLYAHDFTSEDLLFFRKSLGLSVKEFAACFEFSPAALTRIELKQSSGREILKRVEIYVRYPQVSVDQIRLHGGILHSKKQKQAELWLKKQIKK
jgi:HipA-like protein